MKCPHCTVEFHDNPQPISIGVEPGGTGWRVVKQTCPACKRFVLLLEYGSPILTQQNNQAVTRFHGAPSQLLVWPKGSSRAPCPVEVPAKFADDYREACLVLPDSSKAAAALGRRCLQNLLRDEARVKPGNLADEIQQVIDGGKLPADLTDSIDAIRNIGNFAAHPLKSQQTGQILEVESGEAEWTLDVIESLFEFYFVRPAALQRRKAALNQKLQEAGKPPMR